VIFPRSTEKNHKQPQDNWFMSWNMNPGPSKYKAEALTTKTTMLGVLILLCSGSQTSELILVQ
jgi:hypothetical protein